MRDNMYCKIYLSTELVFGELYQCICSMTLGRLESVRTIKTDWGEIDLCKNSEFSLERVKNTPEDFVFWQYYLDIEPKNGIDVSKYIEQIAKLLKNLNLNNMKVVASCDFEEHL